MKLCVCCWLFAVCCFLIVVSLVSPLFSLLPSFFFWWSTYLLVELVDFAHGMAYFSRFQLKDEEVEENP